ncbi:MAG: hypothetical protein WKF96_05925 [Solirubrobacteraceae bacterium]
MHNDRLIAGVADFSAALGVAFSKFAADLGGTTGPSPVIETEPVEPTGMRQQQIIEIERVRDRAGMKVAEISEALGGYDVANTHLVLRSLEKKRVVELVPRVAPQHWRLTDEYMKGRNVWDREELILALDCFVRADMKPNEQQTRELHDDLMFWALARGQRPRSAASVAFKLANFLSIATDGAEGFHHVGRRDRDVYEEFGSRPDALRATAKSIIDALEAPD